MPTLIDWSTLDSTVTRYHDIYTCDTQSIALAYVFLEKAFGLLPDDINDAITDGPHDRGIDAVLIDDSQSHATVHLFQFKYVNNFSNSANNFPSTEIDKILAFLGDLLQKDHSLSQTCNPLLWAKVQEIWAAFDNGVPGFVLHLCSNMSGLVSTELNRLRRSLDIYRYFEVREHTLESIVSMIIQRARPPIDRKIQAVDKQYFERSDGNIRGVVATVEAHELLNMITDPDDQDNILEDIFDDNVRVYLTSTNKINRRIIDSALSETNAEFWYLNNGITITCDSLGYSPGIRAPTIHMMNVQIVNGGQTSHALFEANKLDRDRLTDVLVLVRIYETKQREISQKIAESTNSQTPIRSRDLRSNDEVQKKLEQEFWSLGYAYDRKPGQYSDQPKHIVIDALNAGQAYAAYFLDLPEVAFKDKGQIFGDLYESIFNDNITARQLLIPMEFMKPVNETKRSLQRAMRTGEQFDAKYVFLNSGAYHVLNVVSRLVQAYALDAVLLDSGEKAKLSREAIDVVAGAVEVEEARDPLFAVSRFFRSGTSKRLLHDAVREYVRGQGNNRVRSSGN